MSTPQQPAFDADAEFDRQVRGLVDRGYPALAGMSTQAFRSLLAPLRATAIAMAATMPPVQEGRVSFLLVVTRDLVPIEESMPLTTVDGKRAPGFIDRLYEPGAVKRFVPAAGVDLPGRRAYLLLDVDRGEEFCGEVPQDAMAAIAERQRTLLTMEEGIALITHHPGVLVRNKCFSLGGSRSGDRRVPAIWISKNAPKLGWCWEGNPHSWLGMASAAGRTV